MEKQKLCRTTSRGPDVFTKCAAGLKQIKLGVTNFLMKLQAKKKKVRKSYKITHSCTTSQSPAAAFKPCKSFNRDKDLGKKVIMMVKHAEAKLSLCSGSIERNI